MKIRRFILGSLLSVCLGFSLVSSVFASTATRSDADYDRSDSVLMREPYFITSSVRNSLLGATNGITIVNNTVDLSLGTGRCISQSGEDPVPGSQKILSTDGHYSFLSNETNIKYFRFSLPRGALPTSGAYDFSYSYTSDIGHEIEEVRVIVVKRTANAAASGMVLSSVKPDVITNAGEFSRSPILIDFRQISSIDIVVTLKGLTNAVGGTLHVRYSVSNQSGGTTVGYTQSSEDSNAMTAQNTSEIAQNTAQLVSTQNETNSKLDQIVQHISDQLHALWDQLAAYLITPWMQQDRDLHQETIDTIEDLDTNVTTTIEEKTEWHANFIIEGLKSLFIPSDEYFSAKISEMQTFFEDKLGFLGYTLTYFIRLLNGIMNASQNSVIRFPGIHAPNRATGEDYVLLPAQDVDLGAQISQISEGNFNLLEFCRTAGDIVLVLSFLVLLQDKLREVEQ